MLRMCAKALERKLFHKHAIAEQHRAVYIYGFELFLSSTGVAISIFIFSCLFGSVSSSFIFSGIFVSLRLFTGGYHAKTYGRCYVLSNVTYMLCFFIAKLLQHYGVKSICPILTLVSMALIYGLTPIKHKNHPMSEMTYKKNQKVSRAIVLGESVCILTAYCCCAVPGFVYLGSVTLLAVAVLMVIPKFKERRVAA